MQVYACFGCQGVLQAAARVFYRLLQASVSGCAQQAGSSSHAQPQHLRAVADLVCSNMTSRGVDLISSNLAHPLAVSLK